MASNTKYAYFGYTTKINCILKLIKILCSCRPLVLDSPRQQKPLKTYRFGRFYLKTRRALPLLIKAKCSIE